MDVGVRELKQNLSEYLHRAERGEIIRVTDRGVPMAMLTAIPGAGRMAKGIEEGWVVAPKRHGTLRPFSRQRADLDVMTVIDEDRRDREDRGA